MKQRHFALRKSSKKIPFTDHLDKQAFLLALEKNKERVAKRKSPLPFGPYLVPKKFYIKALNDFIEFIKSPYTPQQLIAYVHQHFDLFEIYGKEKWSEVLVTGYYTPKIKGSRKKTPRFSTPLYRTPPDLVTINLKAYQKKFKDLHFMNGEDQLTTIRGRLQKERQTIIPYYSRFEINDQNALQNLQLEIVWVDPIEAFFLQIQGSGMVEISPQHSFYLHYDNQNGHSYHSIGKELLSVIPLEKLSLQSIKKYLRTLTVEEQNKILNTNPSYVFFKASQERPKTAFQTAPVPHRTIATDHRFFPKGALGFLKFKKDAPLASRFVLDQDRGGAIKGGYRVDLYLGEGKAAQNLAGPLKEKAQLYYLAPKKAKGPF